jgi:hypothetical protein
MGWNTLGSVNHLLVMRLLLDWVTEVLSRSAGEAVSVAVTLLEWKSVDVLPKVGERVCSMHLMAM